MWKSVFTKVLAPEIAIDVSKSFLGGKATYSMRLGRPRPDGTVTSFLSPEALSEQDLLSALDASRDFIVGDRARDEKQEQERLSALAGKGKGKNPNANTGLSRFRKGEK